MQTYLVARWLMYFYIYCFFGWVWESCYVSVKEKKWVNRGFMKGPLLPIYGSGAVCILLVTLPIRDQYIWMAIVGMAASSVLEYVTGAAMESLFRVRYWDYSTEFLNLNGYICLKSTFCWGVMTFLVTYGVHPLVADLVEQIPFHILETLDFTVTALAGADFATSFRTAIDFRNMLIRAEKLRIELKAMQERMDELERQLAEKAKDTIVEGAVKAKDTLTGGAVKAKDTLTGGAVKAKDTLTGGAVKAKDTLTGGAVRAKDTLVAGAIKVKDTITDTITGNREGGDMAGDFTDKDRLREEWQELSISRRIRLESLRSSYSRSIHSLLGRNPHAVSKHDSETFEALKKAIKERMENTKGK